MRQAPPAGRMPRHGHRRGPSESTGSAGVPASRTASRPFGSIPRKARMVGATLAVSTRPASCPPGALTGPRRGAPRAGRPRRSRRARRAWSRSAWRRSRRARSRSAGPAPGCRRVRRRGPCRGGRPRRRAGPGGLTPRPPPRPSRRSASQTRAEVSAVTLRASLSATPSIVPAISFGSAMRRSVGSTGDWPCLAVSTTSVPSARPACRSAWTTRPSDASVWRAPRPAWPRARRPGR